MSEVTPSAQHPSQPTVDLAFPHSWQAEILKSRPTILPARHYVYPRDAEEVERGALEVLIRPRPAMVHALSATEQALSPEQGRSGVQSAPGHDLGRAEETTKKSTGALAPAQNPIPQTGDFLATCALGFRDPVVPTGLWSCPSPNDLLAVAGGYAYIINTSAPEHFTMLPYRPVLEIRALPEAGLLLFVGHHSILAWGSEGRAWQSEKLSDEGITITSLDTGILRGTGWTMITDKETPFALDLKNGRHKLT